MDWILLLVFLVVAALLARSFALAQAKGRKPARIPVLRAGAVLKSKKRPLR